MKIQHVLNTVRRNAGLTQAMLAIKVDCSHSTIKSIENLKLKLSEKLAAKLADVLNVPSIYLLTNDLSVPMPKTEPKIDFDFALVEWL